MLRNFLANNSNTLLGTGVGLLSGNTAAEQWAGGARGFADARMSAMEQQKKNQTIEYLRRVNPELAQAAEQGLIDPAQAFQLDYQRKQGAKPTASMQKFLDAQANPEYAQWLKDQAAANATNVTVNNQGDAVKPLGTKGDILIQDPNSPSGYRVEQAPGSQAAMDMQKVADAGAAKVEQDAQKAAIASRSIDDIKSKLTTGGIFDLPEAGIVGSRLAQWGMNQEAVDVRNALASLQSIVSFDRLQAMREASPTGGALGAVSERELALLQASMGALSQDSSPQQLLETLNFIQGVMDKFAAYPQSAQTVGGDINSLIEQYAD